MVWHSQGLNPQPTHPEQELQEVLLLLLFCHIFIKRKIILISLCSQIFGNTTTGWYFMTVVIVLQMSDHFFSHCSSFWLTILLLSPLSPTSVDWWAAFPSGSGFLGRAHSSAEANRASGFVLTGPFGQMHYTVVCWLYSALVFYHAFLFFCFLLFALILFVLLFFIYRTLAGREYCRV